MNEPVNEAAKGPTTDGSPRADSAPAGASERAPLGYIASLFGGFVGALASFYLLLFMLLATGHLPPPAFTNSLCIDEKLSFMRDHPVASPDLLVIGSSVAWRHFDGAAVANGAQGMRPLNGGFCGLHANQSVYVANWLLDHEPTVRQVLMIASPQDFAECHNKPEAVFDRTDASSFVYGGASRWPYYIRYFSPGSLFGNARRVKDQRANRIELDPLVFDRFGDGPLNTASSRPTLYYGRPAVLDPACFQALQALGTRLQREGRQLMVVATPLHPDWKAKEDPDGKFHDDFNARILEVVKTTNARYWDADRERKTARASFTDAIHLRWSAAQDFSADLALHLRIVKRHAAPGIDETLPILR
jgi:hypothetical protein